MNSLYELSLAFQDLENMITDPDLELNEETQANLMEVFKQIQADFNTKAENTVKMIRNFEAQADMVGEEIKRLQARKKTLENKSEFLRAGLKGAMEANGIDKVPSALFSITLSKLKAGSVLLSVAPEELPAEYQRVKVEADKNAIKADLKAGVVIDGAELEMIRTLTIK